VAAGLGYLLTKALDHTPLALAGNPSAPPRTPPTAGTNEPPDRRTGPPTPPAHHGSRWFAWALVGVGALASFTMGSNDVANATGSLVGTHTFSPLVAGLVGGAGLAAGVLTWGRPLLTRVAFDIVTVDRPMATAAQLVQAAVVLAAVGFGFFTSMNQALVGAMSGAGAARGRHTVHAATLLGILRGWIVGPGAAVALAYTVTRIVSAGMGVHTVLDRT
jgi:PiT family inorganic phosphate transporter